MKAMESFSQQAAAAIRKNPNDAKAHYNRARAFQYAGNLSAALKSYDTSIRLGFENYDLYFERAVVHQMLQEPQVACADYERALSLNPKKSQAWINLSDAYFRLGNWNRAIECCDKVSENDPLSWSAHGNRAQALFAEKKYTEAVAEASAAVLRKNDSSNDCIGIRLLRADANELLGQVDAADKERKELRQLLSAQIYPDAAAAEELGSHFKHTVKTGHLTLYSDLSLDYLTNYSVCLENFINFVSVNFCQVPVDMHVSLFLLKDKKVFKAFMQKNFGEQEDLYGIYNRSYNSLLTYEGAGFGTITHELMHKITMTTLLSTDPWAFEGIPAYFEKIYGYSSEHESNFLLGFQNPWRIEALGDSITTLSLRKIVFYKIYGDSRSESEERLVSMFLKHEGLLQKYLRLAYEGKKGRYNTFLEAAFDRDIGEIEPMWQDYLHSVARRRAFTTQVPGSHVFDSSSELNAFFDLGRQIFENSW